MVEILDSPWFPRTDEERAALYEARIVGTRHTNWSLLTDAARSSLVHGLMSAAELLNYWVRLTERGQQRGETRFLVAEHYRSTVVGPLLGAVVSGAFAIESFVRLCAELYADTQCEDLEEIDRFMRQFDGGPFIARVEQVVSFGATESLPSELHRAIAALVSFRNDCAHDSPHRFLSGGFSERRKRGHRRLHMPPGVTSETLYPALHEGVMPLTPRHALRAGRTHDDLVAFVTEHVSDPVRAALEGVVTRALRPITHLAPLSGDVERVVDAWETELLPWIESVSEAEREEFYRSVVRSSSLRVVD